ncbi:MAG: oxidoreductase [Bacteroidetes bacterium]|nr:oxidoreductase [Bacteroidota bacterium]
MQIIKSFIGALTVFCAICACQNKPENTFSKVQSIKIDTLYKDTISIRALEIWNDSTVWFGSDQGIIGTLIGHTPKVATISYNDTLLAIRSIAKNKSAVFLLNAGTPAKLYKSYFDGQEIALLKDVYTETGDAVFYDAMSFWDDMNGIAIGDPTAGCMSVILTTNGGLSWHKIPCNKLPKTLSGEAAFAASNTNVATYGSHAWIGTGGKAARIMHTADRGKTWEVIETPIVSGGAMTGIYSLDFYDEKRGVIFGGDWNNKTDNTSNKAITQDGGKNWQLVTGGSNPGYRSCVQFVPGSNGLEIMAIGTEGIDYSYDGGYTWEKLTPKGFYTVRFLNNQIAYGAGKGFVGKIKLER